MSDNNWYDHPYISPDETSDRDDESVEFNFAEYCGPKSEDIAITEITQDSHELNIIITFERVS